MKIIKIANDVTVVIEMIDALAQSFQKVRSDRDSHTSSDSILFSDQWKTTGQTPIDHWGGNFYSMLSVYKKLVERGREEKAIQVLNGIRAQKVYDESNEFWLSEFDKFFGTDLLSKWKTITEQS